MKMNFEYSNSEMNITNRSEKVDEKMGSFVQFPCSHPELWSINSLKKCIFLQFCADISKKSRSIKAIYTYASGRSGYAISQNSIVFYAMAQCFGDISI